MPAKPRGGIHAYPGARFVALVLQDLVPALVVVALLAGHPEGPLARVLAMAVPLVLGWGVLTLHFPSRIEIDDGGISFCRYGRSHRFAWANVHSVRVRRFLVKDRVLVRMLPSSPWRGRYWILDSIDGYEELVHALEAQSPL